MSDMRYNPFRSALSGIQGPTPYSEGEISKLRGQAWREQGLVIVSPSDGRLSEREKKDLTLIAERLYGRRGTG